MTKQIVSKETLLACPDLHQSLRFILIQVMPVRSSNIPEWEIYSLLLNQADPAQTRYTTTEREPLVSKETLKEFRNTFWSEKKKKKQ